MWLGAKRNAGWGMLHMMLRVRKIPIDYLAYDESKEVQYVYNTKHKEKVDALRQKAVGSVPKKSRKPEDSD